MCLKPISTLVGKSLQHIVHTESTIHEMSENTEKGNDKMSDKEFLLKALNVIIFSILTISFVAQVKDQVKNISCQMFSWQLLSSNFCTCKVEKFYEEATTQTQERIISRDLRFPQLMICLKIGYNIDALTKIGQPVNVLSTLGQFGVIVENGYDLDALSVWENGTYSSNDFSISWLIFLGKSNVC